MYDIRFKAKQGITEAMIERRFSLLQLQQTMKGNLKTIPPNIHWHLKRQGEKGVCEITWLLNTHEMIISCRKNRQAPWIEAVALAMQNTFAY